MSCCGRKNSKFYVRPNSGKSCCDQSGCCGQKYDKASCCDYKFDKFDKYNYDYDCCYENEDLDGVSCPFHNNNDCCCEKSLRDALCRLTNQRVIIHTDGCKMCVVIVGIGDCFIKTINPCTQKIVYFNIRRIDNVEDVLPRCY